MKVRSGFVSNSSSSSFVLVGSLSNADIELIKVLNSTLQPVYHPLTGVLLSQDIPKWDISVSENFEQSGLGWIYQDRPVPLARCVLFDTTMANFTVKDWRQILLENKIGGNIYVDPYEESGEW